MLWWSFPLFIFLLCSFFLAIVMRFSISHMRTSQCVTQVCRDVVVTALLPPTTPTVPLSSGMLAGSFAQDSSFIVYRPSQRVAELSSIRPPDVEEDEEAKENGSGERKEEELLLSPRRRPAAERATKQPTLMQVAPQLEPRNSTQAKQQEDKDEGKDEGEEEEEGEDEGDTEMMPEKTLPQTVETAEEADVEME